MLGWFLDQQWPCGVTLRPWAIDAPRLMRRAIGRNMAARELDADWLLYADVDYVFGPNVFFDAPAALSAVKGPLAYVHYITWPIEQADGDRLIERVTAPGFYHYIPGEFPSRTEPEPGRAIGGNQWARGEVVRKTGYVPWGRYQRPASTWQRTYEDAVFRRQLKTSGEPIELDGVYRIRHTLRGRYDIGVQL